MDIGIVQFWEVMFKGDALKRLLMSNSFSKNHPHFRNLYCGTDCRAILNFGFICRKPVYCAHFEYACARNILASDMSLCYGVDYSIVGNSPQVGDDQHKGPNAQWKQELTLHNTRQ